MLVVSAEINPSATVQAMANHAAEMEVRYRFLFPILYLGFRTDH